MDPLQHGQLQQVTIVQQDASGNTVAVPQHIYTHHTIDADSVLALDLKGAAILQQDGQGGSGQQLNQQLDDEQLQQLTAVEQKAGITMGGADGAPAPPKYTKRKFKESWTKFMPWIRRDPNDPERPYCPACDVSLNPKKDSVFGHHTSMKHRRIWAEKGHLYHTGKAGSFIPPVLPPPPPMKITKKGIKLVGNKHNPVPKITSIKADPTNGGGGEGGAAPATVMMPTMSSVALNDSMFARIYQEYTTLEFLIRKTKVTKKKGFDVIQMLCDEFETLANEMTQFLFTALRGYPKRKCFARENDVEEGEQVHDGDTRTHTLSPFMVKFLNTSRKHVKIRQNSKEALYQHCQLNVDHLFVAPNAAASKMHSVQDDVQDSDEENDEDNADRIMCDYMNCESEDFASLEELQDHLQFHAPDMPDSKNFRQSFPCKLCPKMFSRRANLKSHMRKTHPVIPVESNPSYPAGFEWGVCGNCGHKFHQSVLYHHEENCRQSHLSLKTKYRKEGQLYFCAVDGCPIQFSFPSYHAVTVHYQESHLRDEDKEFACGDCGQKFANNYKRNKHVKMKHIKPYICHVCDARFGMKQKLDHHLFIHTGEKPFACPRCDFKSSNRGNLTQHLRVKHNDTGDRQFECQFCNKAFATMGTLTAHFRIKHNNGQDIKDIQVVNVPQHEKVGGPGMGVHESGQVTVHQAQGIAGPQGQPLTMNVVQDMKPAMLVTTMSGEDQNTVSVVVSDADFRDAKYAQL